MSGNDTRPSGLLLLSELFQSERALGTQAQVYYKYEGSRPCDPWRHPRGHSRERQWRRARALFCLSGRGLFDMSAYSEYLNGQLQDTEVSDDESSASLKALPVV
jgi:predicted alternative tryptophan synthase beta-subunit